MNDDNGKQTGNPTQQDNTGVPVQPVNTSAPVQPVSGSANRETEPSGSNEFTPSTPEEVELSPEVEQAGVRSERGIRITEKERAVGIQPSGESVPAPTSLTKTVKFAIPDEEIDAALKAPWDQSRRFWGKLADIIREKIKRGILRIGA